MIEKFLFVRGKEGRVKGNRERRESEGSVIRCSANYRKTAATPIVVVVVVVVVIVVVREMRGKKEGGVCGEGKRFIVFESK